MSRCCIRNSSLCLRTDGTPDDNCPGCSGRYGSEIQASRPWAESSSVVCRILRIRNTGWEIVCEYDIFRRRRTCICYCKGIGQFSSWQRCSACGFCHRDICRCACNQHRDLVGLHLEDCGNSAFDRRIRVSDGRPVKGWVLGRDGGGCG